MNNRLWTMVALVCISAATLHSQVASPPAAPASRADVQKLFEVMNVREQMRTVMQSMVKQQSDMLRESLKKRSPAISEEEIQHLDRTMHEMMKEFPYAAMLNDMIPVYQKHLTKADVAEMTTFYSSPTGKKLLREMPSMTTESMQAAYPTMQAYMEKVMARVDAMAKEEQRKSPQPDQK